MKLLEQHPHSNFPTPEIDTALYDLHNPIEKRLSDARNVEAVLGGLTLSEVAHFSSDKAPRKMERYSLSYLAGNNFVESSGGMSTIGTTNYETPENVYLIRGRRPWLDTSAAVTLNYNGTVCAVGSAGMELDGKTVMIEQLQGLILKNDEHAPPLKYALNSGIDWRKTLVSAWAVLACYSGAERVGIQGATNNNWLNNPAPLERLRIGYDQVAEDLGFEYDPKSKNWFMPLCLGSAPK